MTTEIEWGPEIAVGGKRPEWLVDGDKLRWYWMGDTTVDWKAGSVGYVVAWQLSAASWKAIATIRLPADHPYYRATAAGFTYWPGGDAAPADWDGSTTLFRDGCENTMGVTRWNHNGPGWDIIGYRKRAEPLNTTGTLAWEPGLPTYDPATHSAVRMMTEAEASTIWHADQYGDVQFSDIMSWGRAAGIIRPDPTPLERFMAAHPAADRETAEMVLAWKDGQ